MKLLAKEKTGSRMSIFTSDEKDKLHSFSHLRFYYCKRSGCKGNIQYSYAFYIVPCEYINTKVIVRDENSVIRIYNRKWLPLASRQFEEVLAEVVPAHQD